MSETKDLSYLPPGVLEFLRSKGCEPLGRGERGGPGVRGWFVSKEPGRLGRAYDIKTPFEIGDDVWWTHDDHEAGRGPGLTVCVLWRSSDAADALGLLHNRVATDEGPVRAAKSVKVPTSAKLTPGAGIATYPETLKQHTGMTPELREHRDAVEKLQAKQPTTRAIEALAALVRLRPVPTGLNVEEAMAWNRAMGEVEASLKALREAEAQRPEARRAQWRQHVGEPGPSLKLVPEDDRTGLRELRKRIRAEVWRSPDEDDGA